MWIDDYVYCVYFVIYNICFVTTPVATVVTLKIGTSMQDAKVRMHRPKIGHYEWVNPRKETLLENTEKREKTKIKQIRSRQLVY